MAEFKFDYKITSPQLYEDDGSKLSKDTSRGNITVTADNADQAKKLARDQIKKGNKYKTMQSHLPSQDTSFEKKPRITLQDTKTYLKKIAKKLKIAGKGGSGATVREGTLEIFPKIRLAKQSGGRIDKALPRGSRDI